MIKIKVSNLSNGRYDYDFTGSVSDLDIVEPYIDNYKTNVVLNKFDNQLIVDTETRILANLICDRCAREFNKTIISEFKLVYLFRAHYDETEDESGEFKYLHPDTDKIELDEDVRDFAILAVPMKKLCKENCKGLCPRCGKNLNDGPCNCKDESIDSRWVTLQQLKLKNN